MPPQAMMHGESSGVDELLANFVLAVFTALITCFAEVFRLRSEVAVMSEADAASGHPRASDAELAKTARTRVLHARERSRSARARLRSERRTAELAPAKEELPEKVKEALPEKVSEDILLGIAGRAVSTALCSARCPPPLLGARCLPPFLHRLFGIGSSGIGVGIGIGSSA